MLLMTRPAEQAQKDSDLFKEHGIECLSAPMLQICGLAYDVEPVLKADIIIVTSANALEYLKISNPKILKKQMIAVGVQTEAKAQACGFKNIDCVDGTGQDILNFILAKKGFKKKRFVYLRGRDVKLEIGDSLRDAKMHCDDIVLYASEKANEMSDNIITALRDNSITAVTFLSNRTAENFSRLVRLYDLENALKHTKALCISNSVLECVRIFDWVSTHISDAPNGDAMKNLILQHMKN